MKRLFVVILSLLIVVFVASGPAICDEDGGKWFENITLSGAIEVEAGFEKIDYNDPATKDEDLSDIVIATVELGVDAEITKHVSGHILFFYEDDADLEVDEAIISIDGEDEVPLYLNAGQMYVPFGNFESHMISDPVTLELGETREKAVITGFATDWLDICAGVFNGDIDETGEDDKIESFVAGAVFTFPGNTVAGFDLSAGASYISNIGDSNSLEDDIATSGVATVRDYVAGYSAFISISAFDRLFFNAEYLTAADEFAAGELSFDGGQKFKPSTWYAELAVGVIDDLEIAVRYEASNDGGNFLPEKRYGGAITYGLFENTSLGLEYLHGEFKNNDEIDVVTAQLAIEF